MKRVAADVLTVLCLAGLAAVLTLWARSHRLNDRGGSYHDLPPPPAGIQLSFNHRVAWRTITLSSRRGRIEVAVTTTTVAGRRLAAGTNGAWLPRAPVNGWWWSPLERGREPDSLVPPFSKHRFGLGAWSIDSTESFRVSRFDYSEDRTIRSSGVAAPHWGVAVLLVALPAARLLGAFRRSRRRERRVPWRRDGIGRLAFGLAVASSLLLLATTLVLWHRGRLTGDALELRKTAHAGPAGERVWFRRWGAFSGHGAMGLHSLHQHPGGDGPWTAEPWRGAVRQQDPAAASTLALEKDVVFQKFGFRFAYRRTGASRSKADAVQPPWSVQWQWIAPNWFAAGAFSVLPSVAVAGWVRHRRRLGRARRGRCWRCGYDLRESRERCPECGEAVFVAADVRGDGTLSDSARLTRGRSSDLSH